MLAQQKQLISGLLQDAVNAIIDGQSLEKQPVVALERPRDASHGDIACNIAMQLSKPLKKNPREIAQTILSSLMTNPLHQGLIESGEIAGPGFINLRLTASAKQDVVKAVMDQKDKYGYSNTGTGRKVMVEFVSANRPVPFMSAMDGRAHWVIPSRHSLLHRATMSRVSFTITMPVSRSIT